MKKMNLEKNKMIAVAKCIVRSFSGGLLILLLLITAPAFLFAQQKTITGHVTNEAGAPVAASVTVKGSTTGTAADANGNFSIQAAIGVKLVVSAAEYISQEFSVGKGNVINVILVRSDKALSEVVIVGYGTQRKKDVTGAIVSVNEQALREVPSANLVQALQGKAAGLEIQRSGTTPGAGGQIRIRGTRSISGSNDPLFILDGIPFDGNLNDINPDDVASIDILKDASATVIYGSRGANGVILITTKKGRNGETRVSYSGYYGIGKVADQYPIFNATEYQAMRNTSTWGQGYQAEELKGKALGRNTNWQDLMYANSMRTDQNISVIGGAGGSTFSLGGGYYKETALLPGQDFTRFTLRAAIDSRIGKRIKVGITSMNQVGIINGSQFVNGATMFPTLAISPLMAAFDSAGNVIKLPNGNIDDNNAPTYSPLLLKNNNNNWVDKVRRLTTTNTVYGEVEIIKGLRYRANLGVSYRQQENDQFQSGNTATNPAFFRGFKGNTALVNNSESWGYTLENLLYYDKTIAKDHRINVTALYSIQENHNHNTQVAKDSITEDFVQFYNLAQSSVTPAPVVSGNESSSALISYMGRINYAYKDKYMLTASGRIDGSSRLAPGHKFHSYTGFSTGWNISSEEFMKNIKPISNLKLRAGYGQTSNQAVGIYASLGLVSNANNLAAPGNVIRYNYGPTVVTGYQVITLPNPGLDWEYTKTLNIGLDFGLLDNRITGAIEYYNSKTNKILYSVALPPTSGVQGNYQTNVGEMENKGFEFSVSSLNYRSASGFTWNTDLNFFVNKNKILKLSSQVDQEIGSQLFKGYPMSAIYDYNKLGIWQISEAAEAAKFSSIPGQLKLEDHNGDGKINDADRYVIGNGDAKIQGGFTNRFAFKGIDFSFFMYARLGGTLISQVHQPFASYLTVMDGKRNGIKVDYWTPTNASNWFPMPQTTISPVSTAWSTLGYYSASFVKLRSINVGYTFNNAVLKKIGGQSVRVYFAIDNVSTLYSPFYKQTGIDPEGTGVGSQGVSNPGNIRGGGNGTITIGPSTPPARTFTFGANITL